MVCLPLTPTCLAFASVMGFGFAERITEESRLNTKVLAVQAKAQDNFVPPEYPCGSVPRSLVCGTGRKAVDPVYIDEGVSGFVFIGYDAEDHSSHPEMVIVKLMRFPGTSDFLHRQDVRGIAGLLYSHVAEEAKRECKVGLQALERFQSGALPEAQRIRVCYGTNIDQPGQARDILYLKLQDAGGTPLSSFIHYNFEKGLRGIHVVKIFKMLLQGFKALNAMQWVMHDFHSGNVMVREDKGSGDLSALLIDFGYAIPGTKDAACGKDSKSHFCNEFYAPPEYEGIGFKPKASCGRPGFDPEHPEAFDMYSVGILLFELLIQRTERVHDSWKNFEAEAVKRWQLIKTVREPPTKALLYHVRETIAQKVLDMFYDYRLLDEWNKARFEGKQFIYNSMNTVAKDITAMRNSAEFLRKAAKLLSVNPAERPTASELLKHPFMKSIRVPASVDANVASADGGDDDVDVPFDSKPHVRTTTSTTTTTTTSSACGLSVTLISLGVLSVLAI